MKCIYPKNREVNINGVYFWKTHRCGTCPACIVTRREEWQCRIILEMLEHENTIMVTLTYNDAYLPNPAHVDKEELRNFFKRFRKQYFKAKSEFSKQKTYQWTGPEKIRYFAAAEYGKEDGGRPHYHVLIFGLGPEWKEQIWKAWAISPDSERWKEKNKGIGCKCRYCRKFSERTGMYPMGHIDVEKITRERVWYVTKYLFKKSQKEEINLSTGEITYLPGFHAMSKKPGLGQKGIDRIIDTIQSNPVNFFNQMGATESPINCIQIGKRKYPLGDYFRRRLKHRLHVQLTDEGAPYCYINQRQKDAILDYFKEKPTIEQRQEDYFDALKKIEKKIRRKQV